MRTVRRSWIALALPLALGLGAAVADARQEQAPAAGQQPAKADGKIANDPAGAAAFERAFKAYRAAKSYRHTTLSTMVMSAKDATGADESRNWDQEQTFTLFNPALSNSPRFKVVGQYGVLASDGVTVTTYVEDFDQYMQTPVSKISELGRTDGNEYARNMTDAAVSLFFRMSHPGEELDHWIIAIKGARPEALNGRPGTRVDVVFDPSILPESKGSIAGSFWFDEATGMVGQIVTDMTETYRGRYDNEPAAAPDDGNEDAPQRITVDKAEWIVVFKDMVVNGPVAEADVAFAPPESAKKVTSFKYNSSARELAQLELIGKTAPEFSGEQFKDGSFSIASQRGRVVVMDFWATWCGPCVAAIPSMQTLSEKFKDKPVTVVGINQDRGATKKVLSFLEKKNITFPQVNDKDSSINTLYKVTGIPCAVIIDQQGVIQDIHVGGSADLGDELAEKVDKLLKGEKILDAKELESRISDAKGEEDEDDGVEITAASPLPSVNPQRLTLSKGARVNYLGRGMSEIDVDGDGVRERVFPTMDGKIVVVGADGTPIRTVRFKGVGSAMIDSVELLRIGSEERWITSATRYSRRNGPSKSIVGMYNDQGEEVWKLEIPGPAGSMGTSTLIATGNLAGDAQPEIAMLTQSFSRAGRSSKAMITVVDVKGETLTRTEANGASYVTAMWIAPGASTGAPGTIHMIGNSTLRYTLDLNK